MEYDGSCIGARISRSRGLDLQPRFGHYEFLNASLLRHGRLDGDNNVQYTFDISNVPTLQKQQNVIKTIFGWFNYQPTSQAINGKITYVENLRVR